jgi:hypothetical protein
VSVSYKILFTVTLRHDYYANRACNDFTVIPSPDSIEILKQHRLVFRQAGNKIIVLTPEKDLIPDFELANGLNFRFYLFCDNPYFTNFTNWDQQEHQTLKFYASNQSNNFSEGTAYLTQALEEYSDQSTYRQGSLVVNNQGEVTESIQVNPSGTNSKPLSDKKFWRKHADNKTQYATAADLITYSNNFLPRVMLNGANIKLEIYNNGTKKFTTLLVQNTVALPAGESDLIKTFTQLPPQRYMLTVNGEKKIVYYDPHADAKKSWGIIEIHHQGDLPAGMQFLANKKLPVNENKKPNSKNYIIHFHNRSVLWKYNLRVMDASYSVSDNGATKFAFEKKESAFISEEPIPFTEEPRKTLSLKKNNAAVIDVLKNPAKNKIDRIERTDPFDPQKKKTVQYLCSEMYLTI